MSFIPDDALVGRQLIAQYIIQCRPKGSFLPYQEYQLIDRWLSLGTEDEVLLILHDLLPKLYKDPQKGRIPASLKRVDKQVSQRLLALKKRYPTKQGVCHGPE